jgi:hypothetical protein
MINLLFAEKAYRMQYELVTFLNRDFVRCLEKELRFHRYARG